jgi:hypothetical protein
MNKMLIKITGIFLILSISGIYANPNGKNIFNLKDVLHAINPMQML